MISALTIDLQLLIPPMVIEMLANILQILSKYRISFV